MTGPPDSTDGMLSVYGRRRRWVRALELNVAAWSLGLISFFVTGNAILALVILGAILFGGFAWDVRQASRFIETIRSIRSEHPDWADDRVFEAARERRRR